MLDLGRLVQIFLLHPFHPLTVHFPVALSFLGLLFVLLAWWRKDSIFEKSAFYLIALLPLATLVAIATGIADNLSRYNGLAPNAQLKVGMGVVLLVVSGATALWRSRNPRLLSVAPAMYLYILAFVVCVGLVTALGFLGGIIVWGA